MDHPLLVHDKPALLADYPVVIRLLVQWGEQDAFGHVNNVSAIRWFESARIAYLDAHHLDYLMGAGEHGIILASISCSYRKQLLYPDVVYVGASIIKIGKTSFVMKHAVFSEKLGAIAAEGESVIVLFDYQSQRPIRVPDELRSLLQNVEGKSLSGDVNN